MSHSTTSDHYLRYALDIKTPRADEAEAIDGIIKAMTHQSEKVADREKHAVRASHANALEAHRPLGSVMWAR